MVNVFVFLYTPIQGHILMQDVKEVKHVFDGCRLNVGDDYVLINQFLVLCELG